MFQGHNQIEVADYFADLVIADPRLLMDHKCTHKFIRFLFNTNFKNLRKDKWEKLEPIIKNLPILTDVSLTTEIFFLKILILL